VDRRIEKWKRWLSVIRGDIQQLLVNREIFWDLQELVKNNPNLNKPSAFYQYLGDTYVSYIVIGIRRQAEESKPWQKNSSVSFLRLLGEIAGAPSLVSRSYFRELYKGTAVEALAEQAFDRFCGPGQIHIRAEMVRQDSERLKLAASTIKKFADKCVAHRDARPPSLIPKFAELDECLDSLDELYCKYHQMLHGEVYDSLLPEYLYDWKEVFEVPWIADADRSDHSYSVLS
jgi:hypothetical protein